MVDHASKGMTSLAIDSVASYGWNCMIIARYSSPVRTGLRGASQVARKWRMAVVYAFNKSEIGGCCGTCSQRWSHRGWWMTMVNDSTNSMGSSGMFDVYIVLFTFLAHFGYLQWSSFTLPSRACSYVEYFTSNIRLIRAMHFLSRV